MLCDNGSALGLDGLERHDAFRATLRCRGSVEHDHVPEAGKIALHLEHLVQLRGGRYERRDRFGIAQDVFGLLRGERRVDRDIGRARGQAGAIAQRPLRTILRDNRDLVARFDAQLAEAEGDRLDALERLTVGDGHPGAAHLRAERRRWAGVPIDRGEEQLIERTSVHGLNSTTNVTGLPFTAVWFTWFIVAVMTTESGAALVGRRTRTAARPVAFVKTVSLGTNVTPGPPVGKVSTTAKTTRRFAG